MKTKCLIVLLSVLSALSAYADEVLQIKAANVTGWNRYLGQARYRWDFLVPPLDLAGANTVGEFDPGAAQSLPLTSNSPASTILASTADPFLEIVFPGLDINNTQSEVLNVPIREISTLIAGDLATRGSLPFISDATATERSQALPKDPDPITLGDWFKASGSMVIQCRDDGSARLHIQLRDLIPNRAYTVWAMWHLSIDRIFPQPFGGVPNGYITDSKGNADFRRELNFCPMEAARDGIEGSRLLSIITHLHLDHILYGGVPVPGGVGLPPGTVAHMQLEWNFPGSGVPLL